MPIKSTTSRPPWLSTDLVRSEPRSGKKPEASVQQTAMSLKDVEEYGDALRRRRKGDLLT